MWAAPTLGPFAKIPSQVPPRFSLIFEAWWACLTDYRFERRGNGKGVVVR